MSQEKILIVDDDKELVLGLEVRLKAAGYTVISAPDAISAVRTAERERPDCIILDIGLPGGDGFLVMRRLRSMAPLMGIPIIIFTGREAATNQERAVKAGANAFFQKPTDNEELLSTIRRLLGTTPQGAPKDGPGKVPAAGGSKTILIVDDDRDFLSGLNARLKASGYKVVCAADAITAVGAAVRTRPDLIILDIGLPGGDGFAVIRRLSTLPSLPSVPPFIVLTGRDPAATKAKALEAGARAFFAKPADNEELLGTIRNILSAPA